MPLPDAHPSASKRSRRRPGSTLRTILAPGFVGVLGLAIALASTVAAHRLVMTAEMARFERLGASAQSVLNGRLDTDVDAFERFVGHLSPRWRRRTRSAGWAEKSARPGPSAFSTGLGAAQGFVVRHVHPSPRAGLDGVGQDLSQYPTVFSAMEKAAAIGEITSSDYVELDPASHQGGFFTFFPVYRFGARLDTVSDRYEALREFVFTTRSRLPNVCDRPRVPRTST